jgi:hypothetical protein
MSAVSVATPSMSTSSRGMRRMTRGSPLRFRTTPVATSPAASPASVPSTIRGKTLLVPVESGSSGTSPQPLATTRFVPSPPSVTITAAPRSRRRCAASVESLAWPRTGIESGDRVKHDAAVAAARSTMPYVSGRYATWLTLAASSPSNTRRTILIFSLLSNVEPWATRRRMSLPDAGFAMIPTKVRSVTGAGKTPASD